MKIDLGYEDSYPEAPQALEAKKEKDPTICYPTFYVGNRYGPEREEEVDLGQLKGGQVLDAKVRVKQVDRSEKKDGKVKFSYDFEVVSLEVPGAKQADTKSARQEDEEAVDKGLDEATKEDDYEEKE